MLLSGVNELKLMQHQNKHSHHQTENVPKLLMEILLILLQCLTQQKELEHI